MNDFSSLYQEAPLIARPHNVAYLAYMEVQNIIRCMPEWKVGLNSTKQNHIKRNPVIFI
jgi:hypothetical protein